jgi:hypothetical protein
MAKKVFKVVGITFSNGVFGGSRQEVIKKCKVGEPVLLERDYSNKHDDYAVKVLSKVGEQIGYIPKSQSKRVFISLEKSNVTAKIDEKYSFKDDYDDRLYGVKIEVKNLLTVARANEIDNKGCAGVVLLSVSLGILGIMSLIF